LHHSKAGNPQLVRKCFIMPETQKLLAETPVKNAVMRVEGNTVITSEKHAIEAFGVNDIDFIAGLSNQIVQIGSQGKLADEKGIAFVTSIIAGIKPRDTIEAMLAAQMAAVHNATMVFARRLNHVDTVPQQDSASRAFNQLARTFAAQVEAIKRHRNGGNQNVTVKHVHVHEGGQAIVGDVHTGKRANENK
jgi:hypothetical protein